MKGIAKECKYKEEPILNNSQPLYGKIKHIQKETQSKVLAGTVHIGYVLPTSELLTSASFW